MVIAIIFGLQYAGSLTQGSALGRLETLSNPGDAFVSSRGGPLERLSPGAAGPALYTCTFDAEARLREVRVQPLEPLGGTIFSGSVPRYRRQMPLMPEVGSAHAERTLQFTARYSQELATDFQIRDGVGLVTVP